LEKKEGKTSVPRLFNSIAVTGKDIFPTN